MNQFIIALGLISILNEIHGIPVMNGMRATDPSAIEEPKAKDWINIQPSWSFSSIPPMNRLFRNVEFDESEIELLKRRIENLETSQKEIYELMKKIPQYTCHFSSCKCEAPLEKKVTTPPLKPQETVHERKLLIPSTISTTTVTSTIDYALKNIAQSTTIPVKSVEDKKSETIAPIKSEQSTTTTMPEKPIDKSTASSSRENNKTNLNLSDEIRGAD